MSLLGRKVLSVRQVLCMLKSMLACIGCRCCSGGYWVDKFEFVNWPYVRPVDLAKAQAAKQLDGTWRPPVFERPAWCGTLQPLNERFTHYPNHPCQYLGDPDYGPLGDGNSTAVSAAAAGAPTQQQQRQQRSREQAGQLQQLQRQHQQRRRR